MRTWLKPACVVSAWSLLLITLMLTSPHRSVHPAQANPRTPGNSQITLTALTVAAVPVATARPAAVRATTARPAATYVVQPGDTLSGIAARFAVPGGWPALYAANRPVLGPDPDTITPGIVLALPGLKALARYTVHPGDTLSGIAAALAVPGGWPALYAANRPRIGPDPGTIHPGTVLALPHPAPPAPSPGHQQNPAPPPSPGPRHGNPAPSASPNPRQENPAPSSSPAPRRRPTPAPASQRGTPPPATGHASPPAIRRAPAGMPSWLKFLLLALALAVLAAFLTEPVLALRRRRPAAPPPGPGAPARPRTPIILADHDRLVITRDRRDNTVYVLRPPGQDPRAILQVARLVLPEDPYRDLARQLGMPASWPIVLADHDRLVITRDRRDDTVYVLRPPGEDPRAIMQVARLVLPEDPYRELAEQLGVAVSWPME